MRISAPDVTQRSARGMWLSVDQDECFVGFAQFGRFRTATVESFDRMRRRLTEDLRWPDSDVDGEPRPA